MMQLEKLEQQNIIHLGITTEELEKIVMGAADVLEKFSITERIDEVVGRAKNFPPKKSVEMVLSVCEDILCQPLDGLATADRDILLGVLARYTMMKRQIVAQEKAVKKPKSKKGRER
ncbi:MAG: hypothetical protein LBJ12_05890 [Oscillospiraceae bacterium]|jgi:hypothetical protein|nr:hypothetical protein [Oscillospiraceae bacterium]